VEVVLAVGAEDAVRGVGDRPLAVVRQGMLFDVVEECLDFA
jgi:hypothetical protein